MACIGLSAAKAAMETMVRALVAAIRWQRCRCFAHEDSSFAHVDSMVLAPVVVTKLKMAVLMIAMATAK